MSMTIQEAIKRINEHMSIHKIGQYPHILIAEALHMALDALREKADREDPKPLTLEELWELKAGDVIWHQSLQGLRSCFVVLRHHDIEIFKSELTAARYGKTWFAYRHKPKEVTK